VARKQAVWLRMDELPEENKMRLLIAEDDRALGS